MQNGFLRVCYQNTFCIWNVISKLYKGSGFTFFGVYVVENLHAYLDREMFERNIKVDFDIAGKVIDIFGAVSSYKLNGDEIFKLRRFAVHR